MNSTTLKYHKLVTLLTELALVCLVFVAIVAFIPRKIQLPASDTLHGSAPSIAVKDPSKQEGESDRIPLKVEIVTDEDGNSKITYVPAEGETSVSGSLNEYYSSYLPSVNEDGTVNGGYVISGDLSDKIVISGGDNSPLNGTIGNEGFQYEINMLQRPVTDTVVTSRPSVTTALDALFPVLACVLLLLYALKFYQHPKAAPVMSLIFAISFITAALALGNIFIVLIQGAPVLAYLIAPFVRCILFALLAILALKDKLSPKIALVAMICILASEMFLYFTGNNFSSHDMLGTVSGLIQTLGFVCFTVAWFLCTVKVQVTAPEAEPVVANTAE